MKTYRVYVVKQKKTNKVIYVGMTKLTLYKRFSGHVQRKGISRDECFIELVKDELTMDQASTLEEMLINQYQTRENGLNKASYTPHGYSITHSEEQKKKWSEERKGIPIKGRITREGFKNSPEHRQKIAASLQKKIICLNNGKTYLSIKSACKELDVTDSKVSLVLHGKRPHTKGYKFKFL